MAKPATRAKIAAAPAMPRTYFVTSTTRGRRALFQADAPARCFFRALFEYRNQGRYAVHEFVLMPNHFHLLLTVPAGVTIERAVQLIKGKSAYRLSHELGWRLQVWQRGFTDHHITDVRDYARHCDYIMRNAVRRRLAASAADYRFCSAYPGYRLDPPPQDLSG